MKKYRHLTLEEREILYAKREQGWKFRRIGELLGRSHTTLSREYKRNAPYFQQYLPCKAQKKYEKRCEKQRRKAPLKCPFVLLYVRKHLKYGWSPEIISGRLSVDNPKYSIHHETIYRYIYRRCNRRMHLEKYLTLKHKRRRKKYGRSVSKHNHIKNRVSIEERPPEIKERVTIGHWETDLMEGPRSGSGYVIQGNIERRSRVIRIRRMKDKKALTNTVTMYEMLKGMPVDSITADNGKENAYHEVISNTMGVDYYFCHPYSSWEKGSIENAFKRVRKFIPKGMDISLFTDNQILEIENRINNTPMKCLGWLTPIEFLKGENYVI